MNDPTIQQLAKFAVAENNKLHSAKLRFKRVLEGHRKVEDGYVYKLILEASCADEKIEKYEANVLVQPWNNHFMKLTSFHQKSI